MTPCPLPCKFDCEYEDKEFIDSPHVEPSSGCPYQAGPVIGMQKAGPAILYMTPEQEALLSLPSDIPGVVMENARKCRQMGLMALAEQRMKDDATRVLCYGVPLKTFGNFIMGGQGG